MLIGGSRYARARGGVLGECSGAALGTALALLRGCPRDYGGGAGTALAIRRSSNQVASGKPKELHLQSFLWTGNARGSKSSKSSKEFGGACEPGRVGSGPKLTILARDAACLELRAALIFPSVLLASLVDLLSLEPLLLLLLLLLDPKCILAANASAGPLKAQEMLEPCR